MVRTGPQEDPGCMLERTASWCHRHRWLVLSLWLVAAAGFMVVAGAAAAILFARRTRARPSSGVDGLAIGCGGALAIWGGIVVVVATVLQGP